MQRICVDDCGKIGLLEQPAHERLCLRRATQPRADRERARPTDRIPDIVERTLHGLEQLLLEDGQRVARSRDGDVAGVGAERRPGGEARGPGQPRRAADDKDRAGGVLRVARRAKRHTL